MKKLTLALVTGLMSVSGWSACTYNFDASLSQIQTMMGYAVPNLTLFPQNSNQKVGLTLQSGIPAGSSGDYRVFVATSNTYANNAISIGNNSGSNLGDKVLPSSGIVAFEFSYKVPNELSQTGQLATFPVAVGGNMENGKRFQFATFYANNTDSTGVGVKNDFSFLITADGKNQIELNNINGSHVSDPAQLQKIGFYLNQSSNQVGLIVNGVNHGYVYSLPSKANNIGFLLNAMYQNIDATDVNKLFSIELITDSTKMTQTYPTGTKDICGNTI
ncbi:DUF4882 family protein [Acinetobacter sp.]|uniref:DUF4882 family protein n=1 Tax=Acinetobacter sp. TaxID=472 RepID=UPI00334023C3